MADGSCNSAQYKKRGFINDATQSGSRFAAFGAVAAWLTLALQFYLTNALVLLQGRPFLDSIFVFFLYFTILTNLLSAIALPDDSGQPVDAP